MLELQWRGNSKKSGLDPVRVTSIEHADKNPKEIMKWIASIQELHRTKPPPQVHYTKSMPDIEQLMQVWPDEFEELLKTVRKKTTLRPRPNTHKHTQLTHNTLFSLQ